MQRFERSQAHLWLGRTARPAHDQYYTPKLPPQILFVHIVAILNLSPPTGLPNNLLTARLGGLFNIEPSCRLSLQVS